MIDDPEARTRVLLAAAKPIKHVTRFQRYLSIGYDLVAEHLTLKHQGVNVEQLPPPRPSQEIYMNKIVETSTPS